MTKMYVQYFKFYRIEKKFFWIFKIDFFFVIFVCFLKNYFWQLLQCMSLTKKKIWVYPHPPPTHTHKHKKQKRKSIFFQYPVFKNIVTAWSCIWRVGDWKKDHQKNSTSRKKQFLEKNLEIENFGWLGMCMCRIRER